MYNFIELVTTGNLRNLLVWGRRSDLNMIWEVLHSEYTSLTKDSSFSASFRLIKEIHILTNKVNITRRVVGYLANRYVPELGNELRKMGYKYKFDGATLYDDLKRTLTQCKSHELRLVQAEKEYTSLTGKESATKQDYYDMLAILGKFQGANINPRTMTVIEFVSLSNLYKKSNGQ